jgi:hypothetical protein
MMTRPKLRSLVFALIAMALAGCAGSEPSNYYLLSALPAPETPIRATPSDQLAVGVGPVTLPMYLDRPQLVTRASPNRLDLAEFNRWAEPLQDMFPRTLAENLSALIGTDLVYVLPRRRVPELDYQVAVEVFRFDRSADGEVKLLARWTISTNEQAATLLTRRTMITEPTSPGSSPEDVIVALSRAVETLGREIARDLQGLDGQASTSSYDVTRIQNALQSKGYDPGPSDGVVGPRTRNAIRRYQADHGARVTGEPSRRLQDMLTGTS